MKLPIEKLSTVWKSIILKEASKPYFKKLISKIDEQSQEYSVYPDCKDWFRAMELTPFYKVKVVIIGQDPYFNKGEAHGLCFSTLSKKIPPSLRNIYKELERSKEIKEIPTTGDLTPWAKCGVLLLNSVLTVKKGCPNSHKGLGWETFTDKIVSELASKRKGIWFVLWGSNAKNKLKMIPEKGPNGIGRNILVADHPSPMSVNRGGNFIGCDHFRIINVLKMAFGLRTIDWNL